MSTQSYISKENKKVFKPTKLTKKEKELKKAKENPLTPSFVNIDRDVKVEDKKNPKKALPAQDKVLSKEEKMFVDLHLDLADPKSAADCAAIAFPELKNPSSKGKALLAKPNVQKAIQIRQERNSYEVPYTEDDIIKLMMTEATRTEEGSSHSARVSAIVQLGKHIGMFDSKGKIETSEQRVSSGPTYQIVNYNVPVGAIQEQAKDITPTEVLESELIEEAVETFSPVKITNYSD